MTWTSVLLWWKKPGWNYQPITFVPEFWIMTERTRSRTQAAKIMWLSFTWRLGPLLHTPPSGSVPGMSRQDNNPGYTGEIVGALERLSICLEELRWGKSGRFWLDCCLLGLVSDRSNPQCRKQTHKKQLQTKFKINYEHARISGNW